MAKNPPWSEATKKGLLPPQKAAGKKSAAPVAKKAPVSKRAPGGRAARGSAHQTAAQKQTDPQNWANIAKDLGNAGDKRFRAHATGAKPNATTRSYVQSTGRGRGSKPQKAQ